MYFLHATNIADFGLHTVESISRRLSVKTANLFSQSTLMVNSICAFCSFECIKVLQSALNWNFIGKKNYRSLSHQR